MLRNHTLDGTVSADDLAGRDSVDTRADNALPVTTDGESVQIGDANVVQTGIDAGDGVIRVVDQLLVP